MFTYAFSWTHSHNTYVHPWILNLGLICLPFPYSVSHTCEVLYSGNTGKSHGSSSENLENRVYFKGFRKFFFYKWRLKIWQICHLILKLFIKLYCYVTFGLEINRKILIVENILVVRLLDLTADFRVKTNAKLTPNFKLLRKSKTGIQSCLFTVNLTSFFFALISWCIFSNIGKFSQNS